MQQSLLVIDDHPLVRRGLIAIIGSELKVDIVGEAETAQQGLALIKALMPSLVLVDIRLGDGNGLELIEKAIAEGVNSKFVILTSSGNEQDFLRAQQLGVRGYLLKEALPDEIINALRIIVQGRKYYDPSVVECRLESNVMGTDELTPREKEVLIALGRGMSNRDIALQMFLSENTVKKHVSQILAKLNLADRTQAALYAYSKGLVPDNLLLLS